MFALFVVVGGCAGELPPELKGDAGGGSGGSGGGGGGTGGAAVEVMCADGMKASAKIVMSCGQTAICHDATAASAGGLILNNAATLAANVRDKKTKTGVPAAMAVPCQNMDFTYLKGGSNPATGLFLDKLKMPPPCGASMPFAKPLLPAADIECLTKWALGVTSPGAAQ